MSFGKSLGSRITTKDAVKRPEVAFFFKKFTDLNTINPRIIPIGADSVEKLMAIEQRCFSNPWTADHFISAAGSSFVEIFGYCLGETINGYIVLYRIKKVMIVANLAVSPEERRKGIGRILLEFGIECGRRHRCNFAVLDVRKSNQPAIDLYRTLGFNVLGSNRNYYSNPTEDSFIMGRPL